MIGRPSVAIQHALGHILWEQRHGIFRGGLAEQRYTQHCLFPAPCGDHEHSPPRPEHGLHPDGERIGRQRVKTGAEFPFSISNDGILPQRDDSGFGLGVFLQADPVVGGIRALVKRHQTLQPTPPINVSIPPSSSILSSNRSGSKGSGKYRWGSGTFSLESILL